MSRDPRDEWIDEHYDPTTDDFDEPMPEEYRCDDEEWDEDIDSDTWIERHS